MSLISELDLFEIIYDDADGELQEESSKDKQENAPQRNQEDEQEKQTNIE